MKARFQSLLAPAQNRRHHARTAASVKHCKYNKWLFVRSVRNQVVSHDLEAYWMQGKICPLMFLVREGNQLANCLKNLLANAPGCRRIVFGNVLPDFSNVRSSVGMKSESLASRHFGGR